MFPAHVLVEVSPEGRHIFTMLTLVILDLKWVKLCQFLLVIMNLFLWHLLVDIVEVLGHIPRPHRRVFATLTPIGYSHEGFY